MRKGQNPSKDSLPAYSPPRLGIAIVSYIPTMAGYFEHSLEVLKYEIASIHHSTSVEFDLYVFDNGSCAEARTELFRLNSDGWIDFLFASRHNLGKVGVINWILGAVPNELICFADSDVIFRPGWFENSLAILDAYPKAGLISAQPCLDDVLHGKGQAQEAFDRDPGFKVEVKTIDPRLVDEYATGFGYNESQREALKRNQYKFITHLRSGVRAVVGATHVQFIIPRAVARQVVPLPATMSLSRLEDRNFNQGVDNLGYYHLSTPESFYYHMGNIPDQNILDEIPAEDLQKIIGVMPKPEKGKSRKSIRLLKKLSRLPVIRSVVYRSYKLLFELYS